ncbi:hypothetical protein C5708_00130 [Caulobacter sp. CCUG 60055]|uniref:substrate-binding domain-containing protein n=1 Tax=Caulobacter sp. CCUG 60055 TaxID=2100090 RepID=UPI001FA75115|nr:substrate-binding domain-containing protein [Caulobacter sp. CCUG 60055]MCI3178654.1 hypothetical protein [Caulobacter sp. CCUG 60055]
MMLKLYPRRLASACLFMGVSLLAVAAKAQNTVYGAGSSMVAQVWGQLSNCYALPSGAYLVKGAPAASVTPLANPHITCSPIATQAIEFDATGSGAGVNAVYAHSPAIPLLGSTDAAGATPVYPSIQYALSEIPLTMASVSIYNSGGLIGGGPIGGGATAMMVTPPGVAPTNPCTIANVSDCQIPNPGERYGALVQFPVAIVPIAITYNVPGSTNSIKLDTAAYCKIFNGQITDWNDAAITALNGGSVTGGSSLPIKLVGRVDSSGATSIFTRHLAAVCGGLVTTNNYSAGTATLPASIVSSFTLGNGDSRVATVVNATPGAIAYISFSYVLPAVNNTGANTYNLPTATLQNANGDWTLPIAQAASISFASIAPPQSDASGNYAPGATVNGLRTNPQDWVQSSAATAAIAKPTAANAYPIVGTTNFVGYTCYNTQRSVNVLKGFLTFGGGSQANTILSDAALAQLPSNWLNAINNTFLLNNGDAALLKLYFAKAGVTGTGCASLSSGAGA